MPAAEMICIFRTVDQRKEGQPIVITSVNRAMIYRNQMSAAFTPAQTRAMSATAPAKKATAGLFATPAPV